MRDGSALDAELAEAMGVPLEQLPDPVAVLRVFRDNRQLLFILEADLKFELLCGTSIGVIAVGKNAGT